MVNLLIELLLILLLLFTPIAFGSMDFWAFSTMELGILAVLFLWALQNLLHSESPNNSSETENQPSGTGNPLLPLVSRTDPRKPDLRRLGAQPRTPSSAFRTFNLILLGLFVCLLIFQMIPLPSGILKVLSPKSYELRHFLLPPDPQGTYSNGPFPISFVPFATWIEFFKWLVLIGLFLFLQSWGSYGSNDRRLKHFFFAIFGAALFESLYGMLESFSGHHQAFQIKLQDPSVAGTLMSRNIFAGYLLMVIPFCVGFILSRESRRGILYRGWRHRLSSLSGETVLLAFGVMLMVLGLFFSASRMGIVSLLLSFSLIIFFFGTQRKDQPGSKMPLLILGLTLLWAFWIGLDAVISRFLTSSEDLSFRWAHWVDTVRIVRDFPLFGSGLGTFVHVFPMYQRLYTTGISTHAENDFLQLASEIGLVGIGILVILAVSFFYQAIRGTRSLPAGDPRRYIGIGGLVGLLALILHSMVEANIQIPANAFFFTFILALVLRLPESRSSREMRHQGNPSTRKSVNAQL